MPVNFTHRPARFAPAENWFKRSPGLDKVLWGILFLILSQDFAHVLCAGVPSPTYTAALSWNGSHAPFVSGYRILYGTNSGIYFDNVLLGNMTNVTISGLSAEVTYYFAVTVYDVYGRESLCSSEVSFMPGRPSAELHVTPHGPAKLTVKGIAGHRYEIQATQDLKSWTVLGTTNMGTGGSVIFSDPAAATQPRRFYRLRDVR